MFKFILINIHNYTGLQLDLRMFCAKFVWKFPVCGFGEKDILKVVDAFSLITLLNKEEHHPSLEIILESLSSKEVCDLVGMIFKCHQYTFTFTLLYQNQIGCGLFKKKNL